MAGLVPAIHDLARGKENVDARDKPGQDVVVGCAKDDWACIVRIRCIFSRTGA
jgi:hypothetical protein